MAVFLMVLYTLLPYVFVLQRFLNHSVHMIKMYRRDVDKILNICYNFNEVTDALIWSL